MIDFVIRFLVDIKFTGQKINKTKPKIRSIVVTKFLFENVSLKREI